MGGQAESGLAKLQHRLLRGAVVRDEAGPEPRAAQEELPASLKSWTSCLDSA